MSKQNKKLVFTILISGVGALVSYVVNFLITPYITEHLGIEAYSFISIAYASVNYASILTVALTAYSVRYISVSYHEGKLDDANKFFSSAIAACMILSVVLFAVAIPVISNLETLLNIPYSLVGPVKILFVFVIVNFLIVTMSTPLDSAPYIKNRLDITGIIKVISKLIDAAVVLFLFWVFPANVWYAPVGAVIGSLVIMIGDVILTRRLTPDLQLKIRCISLSKIKDLLNNGIWSSINQLGNVLNSGLDLLISNLLLSGMATGQIAVAKSIETIFTTLSSTVSQPFQPILIKSYAQDSMDKFLKELSKAMRICGFFGAASFAGFFALGRVYYKLWLPAEDYVILHLLTVIAVCNQVTDSISKPVYFVYSLTLKNKIPCFVTIAAGFLNVVSMFLLLKYTNMGAFAIVITTAVIMVSLNIFFHPLYAAKCLKINPAFFYKILIRYIVAVGIMTTAFILIASLMSPKSWITLVISAVTMILLGGGIYMMCILPSKEWKALADCFPPQKH